MKSLGALPILALAVTIVLARPAGAKSKRNVPAANPATEERSNVEARPERSEFRPRSGFHVNLLGPTGYEYVSGGFAIDATRSLELMVEAGYGEATSSAGGVGVTVTGKRKTTMIAPRARMRFGERHAFVLDGTLGFVRHSVSMDASDFTGTFAYTKSGAVPFAAAGAGYGFRSDGAFRLAVMLGVSSALGSLPTGEAAGTMSPADVEALRVVCEDGFAPLNKAHAYAEVSFGWLF